jgi:hypothetical protein
MKNKTIIIILSVLAVLMYTVAVINFCLGDVLNGIADVLMASSDTLIAYSFYRFGAVGRLASTTAKYLAELLMKLDKGVPATLTVKNGKGTLTLGLDEDEDDGEIPEEELTDDEKRVKRMAQEYDELRGRYERLKAFVQSDTFKQLPKEKRRLLSLQCQTVYHYMDILTQRIRIEAKETNLDVDIKGDDTDKESDHK